LNSAKKRSQKNNMLIIFGVTLMVVMGVSSISPVFPLIKEEFNVTEQQVGLLITFFNLPAIFLTPLFGVLADRYGRKKFMVPLLFLFAVSGVLSGLTTNFNILLLLRAINGAGASALGALNVTLMGDLFRERERLKVIGYNETVANIGLAIYPLIGGMLAIFGWQFPFFLSVLAVPVGIATLFLLEDSHQNDGENLKDYFVDLFKVLKDLRIIFIYIAGFSTFFLFSGAYSSYLPFLSEYKFGFPPWITGILMFFMSFTAAFAASQLVKLSDRYTVKWLLAFSYVFYAISLFLLMVVRNFVGLMVAVIIFGMGHGINIPSMHTLTTEITSRKNRGAVISLREVFFKLSGTVAPLMMGFLYTLNGIDAVYLFSAIYSLGIFVLLFFSFKKIF